VADRIPLSVLYRGVRQRVTELVQADLGADETPVPATPGWNVHDVVAHVVGIAEDLTSGAPASDAPMDEWTAGHVARGKAVPTRALLDRWNNLGPAVDDLLDASLIWSAVLDAGAHEYDLRSALGNTSARDSDIVTVGATVLLKSLQPPRPLVVQTEAKTVRLGPGEPTADAVTLTTSTYEVFRWRFGRRSRRQLAAMDWSGDPEPYLDCLCMFGPAERDVIE
jgi:hypothetical protein